MQHLAHAQHGADAEILEVGEVALPANIGLGGDAEHVGGDARHRDKARPDGVARNGFDGGMRRPVVRGEVGGTALHDAAFAALPLAGKHLLAAPAGKGTAERPGVAGRPRGHTSRGDGIAELIEQRHALPPRPCENDDGATAPGLQRGKLTLKVRKLPADFG